MKSKFINHSGRKCGNFYNLNEFDKFDKINETDDSNKKLIDNDWFNGKWTDVHYFKRDWFNTHWAIKYKFDKN